jgi:hypothetical protein
MHRFGGIVQFALFLGYLLTVESSASAADLPVKNRLPSPTGAALRSLVLPGWGQAYVGRPLKAVFYSGAAEGLIYGIYREHRLYQFYNRRGDSDLAQAYQENRNRLGWYLTAAVILASMDAFVDAHLYRFDVSPDLGMSPGDRTGGMTVTAGFKMTLR